MSRLALISAVAIAFSTSLIPTAKAAIIYSDALSGTGSLNASAPGTAVNLAGASASATWTADASITRGATNAARGSGTNKAHGFLPFIPQANYTYTLKTTVAPQGGSWFAVGFAASNNTSQVWQNSPNNPVGWVLVRQAGAGSPQRFLGTGTSGGAGFGTGADAGLQNVTIVLDTTVSPWKFSGSVGASTFGPIAFGSNPTISHVGFGSDNGPGTWANFSLEAVAVPEPTAFAGLAMLGVAALKRRR